MLQSKKPFSGGKLLEPPAAKEAVFLDECSFSDEDSKFRSEKQSAKFPSTSMNLDGNDDD